MKFTGTIPIRDAAAFDASALDRHPAVFRGLALSWPAVGLWTPEYLSRTLADTMVTLHRNDPADGTFLTQTLSARTRTVSLGWLGRGLSTLDPIWSLREDRSLLPGHPELVAQLNHFGPLVVETEAGVPAYSGLWISPKGQVTGLHADLVDIFLIQIHGRKAVHLSDPRFAECFYPERLHALRRAAAGNMPEAELAVLRDEVCWAACDFFAPDYNRHPRLRDAEFARTELSGGDVLFLPNGWWHAVRSETISISVSVERAAPATSAPRQ